MSGSISRRLAKDALAGVCCALPFLDDRAFAGIWIGLGLLLHTLQTGSPGWRWIRLGIASLIGLSVGFYWVPETVAFTLDMPLFMGWLIAGFLLAWECARLVAILGLGGWLSGYRGSSWLWSAAIAAIVEYWIPGFVPWRLGYALVGAPWLLQPCEWFGASFSTLLAFAGAGCLAHVLVLLSRLGSWPSKAVVNRSATGGDCQTAFRSPRQQTTETVATLFAPVLLMASASIGLYRLHEQHLSGVSGSTPPGLTIALVQVFPQREDSLPRAERLTAAIASPVDLVCWPESIGGTYARELTEPTQLVPARHGAAAEGQPSLIWPAVPCPILLGVNTFTGQASCPQASYVSALLLDPAEHRIRGRYDKRHLMPFGETLPGTRWLPALARLIAASNPLTPGDAPQVMRWRDTRLGVLMCYDEVVPSAAQESVRQGAELLISLADGSSFISPTALRQQRQLAQLRAIENRRTLIRCTSTGETCIINSMGQIVARLGFDTQEVLIGNVELRQHKTFFSRWGETLPIVSLLLVGAHVLGRSLRHRHGGGNHALN